MRLLRRGAQTVYVLLLISLALPILAFIGMYLSINLRLWSAFPVPDFVLSMMQRAELRDGIETGTDPKALKGLYEKLSNMSAHSSDAALAKNLHIVFIDFTDGVQKATKDRVLPSSTQKLLLDFTKAKHSAVLLVANRPLLLANKNPHNLIAKLGVEGKYPFDVTDGTGALLAGFRADAFGARRSATLNDLPRGQSNKKAIYRFCQMYKRWQNFFDVERSQIRVWKAIDPKIMTVGASAIHSQGGTGAKRWHFTPRC